MTRRRTEKGRTLLVTERGQDGGGRVRGLFGRRNTTKRGELDLDLSGLTASTMG